MKKIITFLSVALVTLFLFDNIAVVVAQTENVVGNTEDGREIIQELPDSETRGIGNSSGRLYWNGVYSTPKITIEGLGYTYCVEPSKDFPLNTTYGNGIIVQDNPGLTSILRYGFPSNYGDLQSKYGLTNDEAYVATFVAINAYLGNYNKNTIKSYNDPYVNELISRAENNDVPQVNVTVNAPTNTSSYYNATLDRNETELYRVAGGNKITVSNLPTNVFMELENGTVVKNGDIINSNQKFRLINSTNFEGNVSPIFTSDVKKRVAMMYVAQSDVQDLVGLVDKDPIVVQSPNANFTRALIDSTLEITKEDENGNLIENVTFEVSTSNDFSSNVQTVTTDINGIAKVNLPVLQGETIDVYVKEISAPDMYAIDDTITKHTIAAGENISINKVNEIVKSTIEIAKVDSVTKEILSDAVMVIDYYNPNTNEWGIYGEYTTVAGESVKIEEVPYGKYRLREVVAPTGYVLSDLNIEFEVSVDGAVIQLEFPNTLITSTIEIAKVDSVTKEILSDAVMVIDYYNPNTNEWGIYGEYTTVAGESVKIEEVPFGKYRLREVVAPTGYVLSDLNIEFEVSVDGAVIQLEFPNTLITSTIEIAKVDSVTKEILSDAVMVIDYYNPNTNEWVTYGEYTTAAGESVIIEEVPYGKYRLREVVAPTGYVLSDLNIEFKVSVDGAVIQLEFPNTMEIKGLVETGFVDLFTQVILLLVFTYICRRKLYSCIK